MQLGNGWNRLVLPGIDGKPILSLLLYFVRLSKKEAELHDVNSSKVLQWQTLLLSWKEWLKAKESELDNQGLIANDPNVIKTQKIAAEVRLRDII